MCMLVTLVLAMLVRSEGQVKPSLALCIGICTSKPAARTNSNNPI